MRSQLVFPMLLLLFVALCASESAQAQTVQYFPQLADGGGYLTTWYFTGLGDGPASVTIDLFNPNGAPLALATNRGTASSFTFSIAAAGQLTLRTNGAPSATHVDGRASPLPSRSAPRKCSKRSRAGRLSARRACCRRT